MTTPKVTTITRGGTRYYLHPETKERVPGVTSILGMLPKPFLTGWAAKMVAQAAVDNLGAVVNLAVAGDKAGAVDYLKRSHRRFTEGASERGDTVHDLAERLFKGEDIGRVHPTYQAQVDAIKAFLDRYQPEVVALEQTVWSSTHGYAGSFDWLCRFTDDDGSSELILGDNKTTRSGVHAEVAIQLTAYSRADVLIGPDGTHTPMPAIDGAAVLWVPGPEEGRPVPPRGLVPVPITDEAFEVFLHLLGVHRWERERKDSALGRLQAF